MLGFVMMRNGLPTQLTAWVEFWTRARETAGVQREEAGGGKALGFGRDARPGCRFLLRRGRRGLGREKPTGIPSLSPLVSDWAGRVDRVVREAKPAVCRSRTGKAKIVDIGDSSNFRNCLASPPFLNPAHILVCDLSAPFGDRCQHCGALLHMRPVHSKDHRSQGDDSGLGPCRSGRRQWKKVFQASISR